MSSLVGLLKVSLVSDTAEFSAGFDRASKRTEKFGADLKQVAIAAGAAATATIGTLTLIAQQTAQAGDEINKLKDRTGVSVEALSRLKYAAELNDATIQDLDAAFKGLSARMLQSQRGTGEAAEAFAALGIRTTEADGSLRNMDAVLLDIAAAFSKSNDATAKAALAQQLFSEAGVKLLPLLNQGRLGIEALGDEAERLGITFTGTTASAASEFQDNLTRLDAAVTGVKQNIGNALIPALSDLAEKFLDAQSSGLGFWRSLIQLGLSNPFAEYAEEIEKTKEQIRIVTENIERPGASDSYRKTQLELLDLLYKELETWERRLALSEGVTTAIDGETAANNRLAEALKRIQGEQAAAREQAKIAAEAARAIAAQAAARKRDLDAAREGTRTIADQVKAQREQNEEIGLTTRELIELRYTRLQHAAAQLDERAATIALFQPNSDLVTLYEQQAEALRELAEEQRDGALAQASVDAARAAEQEWLNTMRSIEDSLTDALLRGFESGADFAENFRRTLLNMFQTLVLRPIIQPIIAGGLGMLGMGSAAASGGGVGGLGGLGGGGGMGFNPMSFLGGNSIGMGFQGFGDFLFSNTNLPVGNLMTAGTIPNWQFGLAGLGGGLGANLLFGGEGMSGVGGSLGSTLGMAIAGPVGAVLGTVLGGFVGSLFGGSGERFPRTVASSRGTYSDGEFENLGADPDFFPGEDQFGGGMQRALRKLNEAFSERLGSLLEAFDIDPDIEVGSNVRLRRTSGRLAAELFGSVNGEEFTTGGPGDRLQFGGDGEIEEAFAEFVETAMTQGLAAAIQASPLADNIKSIFQEELSGEEIDGAVDALIGIASLKGQLEGMPDVFQGLASSIDEVLATDNFDDFSEGAQDLAELQAAMQTFYDGFSTGAERFRDAQRALAFEFDELGIRMPESIADFQRLAEGLDLTTEDGRELYKELMGLAPAFLTVAQAVEEAFDAISASTANTIEQFTLDTLTDRQKYAYYDEQIASTMAELENAFDPATISQLYDEANADLQAAWNLLSDAEKRRLRDEFIDRALELEALAQEQLSVTPPDLEPVIEDQAQAIGGAVEAGVERALMRVADSFAASSGDQAAAADALRRAVREINVNVNLSGGSGGEVTYA